MLDSEANSLRCLSSLSHVRRYVGSCANQRMRLDLVQVMADLHYASHVLDTTAGAWRKVEECYDSSGA